MKKYLIIFSLVIVCILIFLFGCEYFQLIDYKEWLKKTGNDKVAIYACGSLNSDTNWVYWKNNERPVYLEDASGTYRANSIFVYNKDVYVSGSDSSNYACYWKNGKKVSLSSVANSYSRGIYVIDGVVLNAVRVNSGLAELWRDNVRYELKVPGPSSEIREPACLFAEKNGYGDIDIIVGGHYRPSPDYPCYWSNWGNKLTMLTPSGGANTYINSVFLYNNKVYSCGFVDGTTGYCWEDNAVKYDLGANVLYSIYVDKGEIYLAGYNNVPPSYPYFWKNTNSFQLSSTDGDRAYSIKVFNDDVYVGGQSGYACYWINGSGPYYFNSEGLNSSISQAGSSIFVTWDY